MARKQVMLSIIALAGAAAALLAGSVINSGTDTAPSVRQARVEVLWSKPVRNTIMTTPIESGGALVFGMQENAVEAFALAGGAPLWSTPLPQPVFSVARDKAGTLYAGTGLHENNTAVLAAIEPTAGGILWKRMFKGHVEEPPAIDDDDHRLWTGTGPSGLWALNTRDGSVLWSRDTGHLDGTPLLDRGRIYMPAQNGKEKGSFFYALAADSGQVLWMLDQPGQPWAGPMIDKTGGVIFSNTAIGQIGLHAPGDKGWAQAITTDGKLLWQTALPDMALPPNVYFPDLDLIVFVTKSGVVTALRTGDGSVAWAVQAGKGFFAEGTVLPLFRERLVAVVSEDGVFMIIDAETGSVLFKKETGDKSYSAPLVHDGIIYVATMHKITALALQ